MTTFADMHIRFERFNITEATGEGMKAKQAEVLDVNREQLYEKGTDKNGQELKPYVPAYAKRKEKMRGKRIVDIYLTGELQQKMEIEVTGDTYNVFSPVPYTPYVLNKRPDLFGFTDDGKKVVWRTVQPDVVAKLASETGCVVS